MALFRCNRSGQVVEVDSYVDVKSFRKHNDYTELDLGDNPLPNHEDLIAYWNKQYQKKVKVNKE